MNNINIMRLGSKKTFYNSSVPKRNQNVAKAKYYYVDLCFGHTVTITRAHFRHSVRS